MTELFHITLRKNLNSILSIGLKPRHTQGLTYAPDSCMTSVWLTDNPNYILQTQAGDTWVKNNKYVVLKVDCKNLSVKQYQYWNGILAKHEFIVEGTISSSNISI